MYLGRHRLHLHGDLCSHRELGAGWSQATRHGMHAQMGSDLFVCHHIGGKENVSEGTGADLTGELPSPIDHMLLNQVWFVLAWQCVWQAIQFDFPPARLDAVRRPRPTK